MVLRSHGLWHQVLINKYLKNISIVDWLRGKNFLSHGVFVIWRGFLQTLPWLGRDLAWQVGNSNNILLGIDPLVGASNSFSLPTGLLAYLEDLEINTLARAHNTLPGLTITGTLQRIFALLESGKQLGILLRLVWIWVVFVSMHNQTL